MKIDPSLPNPGQTQTTGAQAPRPVQSSRESAASPPTGAASSNDQATLSPTSATIHRALDQAQTERTARIAKLGEQFRAGTYQVDAEQLSETLMSDALSRSGGE